MMQFIRLGGHSLSNFESHPKNLDLFLLVLHNLSFCASKFHLFVCTSEISPCSDGCSLGNSFKSCTALIMAARPPHLLTAYTLTNPYPYGMFWNSLWILINLDLPVRHLVAFVLHTLDVFCFQFGYVWTMTSPPDLLDHFLSHFELTQESFTFT